MSVAAVLILALLRAGPARAAEEPIDCPNGTHRISTDNPFEPFRCVSADQESKKGFDAVVGPKGFKERLRCPRGTRPEAQAGGGLQSYRCVRSSADPQGPELVPMSAGEDAGAAPESPDAAEDPMTKGCPRGKRKVRTSDPLQPYRCVAQTSRARVPAESSYRRFVIPRQIAFDYAAAFRVQDAWREDVPTLYLKIDDGAAGKPVTITITRYAASQSSYQGMSDSIAHDIEWQGARDGGSQAVGGVRARVTSIPGDTRSVYLPVGKDSYYSFVYSAPADSYDVYLPAFSRLLSSLKLAGDAR